jgi:hypothetical protein
MSELGKSWIFEIELMKFWTKIKAETWCSTNARQTNCSEIFKHKTQYDKEMKGGPS